MSVPMDHLEIEKEVKLTEYDKRRYDDALREYGPPTIHGSHVNETQQLVFELRDMYDMGAVEHIEITPEGIMKYVF